jgi:hypothetical protein
MMILRVGAMAVCLGLTTISASAWPLVTPQEDRRDDAAPHTPGPPDVPGPPTIKVVRPDLSGPIRNPATIDIQFAAGPGRTINMQSFKATYGWLGIDITRRLLQHATKTLNGLTAADVDLPSGNHKVTLSIADTLGKKASRTFQLNVAR